MPTEDEYKKEGLIRSSAALMWCSFALLSFILVETLLATTSLSNKFFYEIASGMFLASGSLYAFSWASYERVGSSYEIISERNNPREVITQRAELSVLGGTILWAIGIIFLMLYLETYLALTIFAIFIIPVYIYATDVYFRHRK